jgi:methylmalonyl-CoA/ethylmalonyl-CoA epimerase
VIKRFKGVTIAVKDLDAAVKRYEDVLGIKPQFLEPEFFAFPGHKGAFFLIGDVEISLVTSEQPESSVTRFLETRGEGVFLISLEVTDAEQARKELLEKGVKLVGDKPQTFSGGKVNFAHPKSMHGVQVEFPQFERGIMFTDE